MKFIPIYCVLFFIMLNYNVHATSQRTSDDVVSAKEDARSQTNRVILNNFVVAEKSVRKPINGQNVDDIVAADSSVRGQNNEQNQLKRFVAAIH
ncbi:hypothetical protein I4U23_015630 [Adineta vaga]|nr:hypothetical protein I4U23_015630 [Adineta vaga]